jgi:hypothetical protein
MFVVNTYQHAIARYVNVRGMRPLHVVSAILAYVGLMLAQHVIKQPAN